MRICLKCAHGKTVKGSEVGSASDRVFCMLKNDAETNQPVACESRRLALPGTDECGPDGALWEFKQ
jgi:hypothetical protein